MAKPVTPSRPAISGKDAAPASAWALTLVFLGLALLGLLVRAILI